MKICKKIMLMLMISLLFFFNFCNLFSKNVVKAATFPINQANLYSKGEVVLFDYDHIGIGVEVTVYSKDGIEYPVYCLNKGKQGITLVCLLRQMISSAISRAMKTLIHSIL